MGFMRARMTLLSSCRSFIRLIAFFSCIGRVRCRWLSMTARRAGLRKRVVRPSPVRAATAVKVTGWPSRRSWVQARSTRLRVWCCSSFGLGFLIRVSSRAMSRLCRVNRHLAKSVTDQSRDQEQVASLTRPAWVHGGGARKSLAARPERTVRPEVAWHHLLQAYRISYTVCSLVTVLR
jgi:hypothetical protein